jgi:hypothetical protein
MFRDFVEGLAHERRDGPSSGAKTPRKAVRRCRHAPVEEKMKVWKGVVLICLLELCASSGVAQEANSPEIFLGEVRSIVLTRTSDPGSIAPKTADGSLIVSNSCGDEMVTFRVVRSVTAMIPIQIRHFTIGEGCEFPVGFGSGSLLVAPGAGPDAEPIVFPVIESGQAEFALVEDERDLQRVSPAAASSLRLQLLPQPVEYHSAVNLRDPVERQAISNRSTLQIRDGKVWIVKGIPLAALFRNGDLNRH